MIIMSLCFVPVSRCGILHVETNNDVHCYIFHVVRALSDQLSFNDLSDQGKRYSKRLPHADQENCIEIPTCDGIYTKSSS